MIYFIYGTDSYRIKEKERELLAQFSVNGNDINLTRITGPEFSMAKFEQAISAVSFFSKDNVLVIENLLTQNKDSELKGRVTDKLKKDLSAKILFIEHSEPDKREKLFKTLSKTENVINFSPLSDYELRQWIVNTVKNNNSKIERATVEALALVVGPNLWRLKNEIEKLVLYAKSHKSDQIEVTDIKEMVVSEYNPNVFQFIESIAAGNKKNSIKLLQQFLDNGENEIYLLSMIVYQFRTLIMIKDLLERGNSSQEITKDAKINPYVISKSLPVLNHYSLAELISYYHKLYKLDTQIKIGKIDARMAVDILVAG